MVSPVPAAAAPARLVSPDTVVGVASPPVNLAVPADGRINGYGVTASVTGVATGTQLGPNTAARGQLLWAFGLTYQVDHSDSLRRAPTPTATLVHDTTRIPLPHLAGTSGTGYYVASVPATAPDVVLDLTSAGYAQDFSLTNMAREGPQPAVLYRDNTGWQTTQPLNAQASLPVPAAVGLNLDYDIALNSLTLGFSASGAHLSWFGPDTPTNQPANPADAWLTLSLNQSVTESDSLCNNGCAQIGLQSTLTAGQITLTLPGNPPQQATLLDAGSGPPGTIFNGIYAWQIPAATTAGTVTISPGNVAIAQQNGYHTFPVAVPGTADLPFTLPAPTPPKTSIGAATKPAHYPQPSNGKPTNNPGIGNVFPAGSSAGGSDAGAIAGGVGGTAAALAAILIAVIVARRRQAALAARPTTQQPPTNVPGPPGPPTTAPTPAPGSGPSTTATPVQEPVVAPDPPEPDTQEHPRPADRHAPAAADLLENPPPAAPPETGAAPADPPVPPAPSGPLRVSVLGPVQIEGWAQRPSRRAVTDIVTYLACHPDRPVTTDRLRAAVASGADSDIDENSLRSYLSHTRRALGAERLPDASIKAGYQLEDVDCDWTRFQQLTAAPDTEPDQATTRLTEALALVRGDPFADGCAWAETELLPEAIRTAVAKAATKLATLTLETLPEQAEHAAGIGLGAQPTDEPLSILALKAAARLGHLHAAWQALQARWAGIKIPAELSSWHDRLAAGDNRDQRKMTAD